MEKSERLTLSISVRDVNEYRKNLPVVCMPHHLRTTSGTVAVPSTCPNVRPRRRDEYGLDNRSRGRYNQCLMTNHLGVALDTYT